MGAVNVVSSHFTAKGLPWGQMVSGYMRGLAGNNNIYCMINDPVDTAEIFRRWLADENVQFVYELDEPAVYQLTPAEVSTLLGQNVIRADCGGVSVVYRADPTLAYNALSDRIAALEGQVGSA